MMRGLTMESCPETLELLRWINGSSLSNASSISDHVAQCQRCQLALETLTNEEGLQPPALILNHLQATYTNEESFNSLRKRFLDSDGLLRDLPIGQNLLESTPDRVVPDRNAAPDRDSNNHSDVTPFSSATNNETFAAEYDSTHFSRESAEETLVRFQPLSPDDIPDFKIEKLIGRGGFARVYQAWDTRLNRSVAIKVLDSIRLNPRNRHRFLREAKTASSINSPNVVRVLSSGESGQGQPFIVMELVRGQSLAQWISSLTGKQLGEIQQANIQQGVHLLIQICSGVQAVHDAGLVHRDIKPGNLFVDQSGTDAKLGDFGLARILSDDTVTLTQAAELAGTPAYMSPEQTHSQATVQFASDIYSLGATLYHLLTGQPPFRGSTMAILRQVNENLPLPPRQMNERVSRDLEKICLKALEKEPHRRYASAQDLADDLQRALDGRPVAARSLTSAQRLMRWAKMHRSLATVLSLLFLSLTIGTIVSTGLWRWSDHHAKLAERRNIDLKENERTLLANQQRLRENQQRLRQSVRAMVSNSFARKSNYLEMSGDDRIFAAHSLLATYQTIFDGESNDPQAVREVATDLTQATETLLELGMYQLAAETLVANQQFVNHLLEFPSVSPEDRCVAAQVYNQIGECLLQLPSYAQNYQAGEAVWKAEATPNQKSHSAFAKALELANQDKKSDLGKIAALALYLQSLRAQRFEVEFDDNLETARLKLQKLLAQVETIRARGQSTSPDWYALHRSVLKSLAKKSVGEEKIQFRINLQSVDQAFNEQLSAAGQETYWYDRNAAVNLFFLGIDSLEIGQAVAGRNQIHRAMKKFDQLVTAFPQNTQFRADLAEALMLLGDIDWNLNDHDLALGNYEAALQQFEVQLKHDSEDVANRRRTAHVYEKVANRLAEMGQKAVSIQRWQSAIDHLELVIASPFDLPLKETDKGARDRVQASMQQMME